MKPKEDGDKAGIVSFEYAPPRQLTRIKTFIKTYWKKLALVAVIVSVPIVITLLYYWFHFHQSGISNQTTKWADFAIFLGVVIAYMNLLVFATLTYLLLIYNARNDGHKEYQETVREKPIIIFSYKHSDKCYSIQNIGKGAALNVTIKSDFDNGKWQYGYIWNSLSAKSEL